MKSSGRNLTLAEIEKHEPRGVSVAEAQNGDSMKSSGRNLTLAAIEKHAPRGVSVAEAQNGDSMKSSGRNLTLAAIEKRSLKLRDERAQRAVVFAQEIEDFLWLRGLGEGGVAAQIAEHDNDFATVAFEHLLVALRDDQLY